MRMGVRLVSIPVEIMFMRVVRVMVVEVVVVQRFVAMLVFVPFADVQPDTKRHQCSGDPEGQAWALAQ
jgi:hypothetical protein